MDGRSRALPPPPLPCVHVATRQTDRREACPAGRSAACDASACAAPARRAPRSPASDGWSPSPRGQETGQKRSRSEAEPRPKQPGWATGSPAKGGGRLGREEEGREVDGTPAPWHRPHRPCCQQKAVCTIAAHEGTLAAIAFNSSGSRLASASEKVSAAHGRVLGGPPSARGAQGPGRQGAAGTHFRGRPSAPACATSSVISADPGLLRVGREPLCPEPRGLTKNRCAGCHRQIRVLGSQSRRMEHASALGLAGEGPGDRGCSTPLPRTAYTARRQPSVFPLRGQMLQTDPASSLPKGQVCRKKRPPALSSRARSSGCSPFPTGRSSTSSGEG